MVDISYKCPNFEVTPTLGYTEMDKGTAFSPPWSFFRLVATYANVCKAQAGHPVVITQACLRERGAQCRFVD